MLRLSKKLMFAIEAVLDIAYNSGAQPVQSREINSRQGIPRRYLEPVLQQLVRACILDGVRGPPSARAPQELTSKKGGGSPYHGGIRRPLRQPPRLSSWARYVKAVVHRTGW